MTIYSVAIVGKSNEPLYFTDIDTLEESLYLQMIAHSSLDIIEEKRKKFSTAATGTIDLYLGHLLSISDYKSFGLLTNTYIKIILIYDINTIDSQSIRDTAFAIHNQYVNTIQNTFQENGGVITSKSFRDNITSLLMKINNNNNNISFKK